MAKQRPNNVPRSQQRLMAEGPTIVPSSEQARTSVDAGRVFGSLLLLLSCALLCVFVLDARFRIRTVDVQGASLIADEELAAAAEVLDKSVFLLDTRAVEQRLADAFGCFEKVRVSARLPDHVTIRVIEKQAVLLWEADGNRWWVGSSGQVLGRASQAGDLPVVHDRSHLPVEIGGTIAGVPWDYIGEVVQALPAVRDFEYTLEDGVIVLVTTGRWPVYLGSDGNAAYKVTVLRELTAALTTQGAQVVYVDLKNERRPAVKLAAS